MKANGYKDDAAEIVRPFPFVVVIHHINSWFQEDPLKPVLDALTHQLVASLSGEAREFYDREFGFFHEITSISGKLKPYIKKTKLEKKVSLSAGR